ncbi:MAG: S41 family peptidase [Bacteroidales bacterium]|nr:S41 family peptidase [Bacteroidales bacterium]
MKRTSIWIAALGILIGVLLTLTINTISSRRHFYSVRYGDWRKLNLILDEVQKNYVDTIDHKGMTEAAVTAALAKLDPHSIYLPPEQLEDSETELAGNFEGIGIQFNVPNDTAVVLEVFPGGPSEKSGLLIGDRILKVDDKVIAGVKFPQDSMVRLMKGPSGTKVTVTVNRAGTVIPFEIIRGKIPLHCIDAAFMVNDTTGYIRLSKFSRTTREEFLAEGAMLLSQGMKRLILDLRDNTGGYLDQAWSLSNQFLERGCGIVYMEGLHRQREDYKADGRGMMKDIGLSILINESTASSSEIVAGAIQDNDRGVIVGRRSFGKGLVQEPLYFNDGSGVRITVARFYSPSGRCIQKPYGDDYQYDIYKRYEEGEMLVKDSIKVDRSEEYHTAGGRTVYGGGGIIPDIFVPVDTTKATNFYIACNRKATMMRFASAMFDKYRGTLISISDFPTLEKFLENADLPAQFRSYAARVDGITASEEEWKESLPYLKPQLMALTGRYSQLGENAFYKLYMTMDETLLKAIESPSKVSVSEN